MTTEVPEEERAAQAKTLTIAEYRAEFDGCNDPCAWLGRSLVDELDRITKERDEQAAYFAEATDQLEDQDITITRLTKELDEAREARDDLIESRDLLLSDENLSPLLRYAIRGYFITSIATAQHLLEGPGEK